MRPERHRHWTHSLRALTVLAVPMLAWASVQAAVPPPPTPVDPSKSGYPARASLSWVRNLEPAALTGSQLPLFDSVTLNQLFVYAYHGGAWQQIPFQLDEVDSADTYTAFDDGLLSGNDALLFMAQDLGDLAQPWEWIDDAVSRSYPRYEIPVADPLDPSAQGWVYLYRSTTLSRAPNDYVSWDPVNNRVVAGTYVRGYVPSLHFGLDSLELNGSGDVLDRAKQRIDGTCIIAGQPYDFTSTENDVTGISETPAIDGPVRLGGGTLQNQAWSYSSLFETLWMFDVSSFSDPRCDHVKLHWIRLSVDWLNPASSGMAPMNYFDSNTPAGVTVDGQPDSVPATPVTAWKQVSGAWGSLVQTLDYILGGGTPKSYYTDTLSEEPPPTGDGWQYGEAGYRVDNPAGLIRLDYTAYVLDPGQPNVGDIYRAYHDNPLQATAAAQDYVCAPQGISLAWRPLVVYRGEGTTFIAQVGEGAPPFTYAWDFGDGGAAAGNPVIHTYAVAGYATVMLTVSNACGTADPVTRTLLVFEPGQAHTEVLPALMRNH